VKKLLLFITIIVPLTLMAWQVFTRRAEVATYVLKRQLSKYGFNEIDSNISTLSRDTVSFDTLILRRKFSSGDIRLNAKKVRVTFEASFPSHFKIRHGSADELSVQLDYKGSEETPSGDFSGLFSLFPIDTKKMCFDSTQPSIHFCFRGSLSHPNENQTVIDFSNLSGAFPQGLMNRGRGHLHFTRPGREVVSKSSWVAVDRIDVGLPIDKISLRGRIIPGKTEPWEKVSINDARALVIGTSIRGQDVLFEPGPKKIQGKVSFSKLNLEELLKFYPQGTVLATGILDGRFEITSDFQSVVIPAGGFSARPPGGRIEARGLPDEKQASSEEMRIVHNALRDYRYNNLEGNLRYAPDGRLDIMLSLKGVSPKVNEKRPIHVNLNIEENVPKLLESLRVVRRIHESMEQQWKKK
jgi:hypothetical protein